MPLNVLNVEQKLTRLFLMSKVYWWYCPIARVS